MFTNEVLETAVNYIVLWGTVATITGVVLRFIYKSGIKKREEKQGGPAPENQPATLAHLNGIGIQLEKHETVIMDAVGILDEKVMRVDRKVESIDNRVGSLEKSDETMSQSIKELGEKLGGTREELAGVKALQDAG